MSVFSLCLSLYVSLCLSLSLLPLLWDGSLTNDAKMLLYINKSVLSLISLSICLFVSLHPSVSVLLSLSLWDGSLTNDDKILFRVYYTNKSVFSLLSLSICLSLSPSLCLFTSLYLYFEMAPWLIMKRCCFIQTNLTYFSVYLFFVFPLQSLFLWISSLFRVHYSNKSVLSLLLLDLAPWKMMKRK